jgi:hypothetical protein
LSGERNGWFLSGSYPHVHLTDEELSHLQDLFRREKDKIKAWAFIAENLGPTRRTVTGKFTEILERQGLLLLDRTVIRQVVSSVSNQVLLGRYLQDVEGLFRGDEVLRPMHKGFLAYKSARELKDAIYSDVFQGHENDTGAFNVWIKKRLGSQLYDEVAPMYFGEPDALTPFPDEVKQIIADCLKEAGLTKPTKKGCP